MNFLILLICIVWLRYSVQDFWWIGCKLFIVSFEKKIIHLRRHHLPVKGGKISVLCSALMAFKQGEIFIVPHLLRHEPFLCYPSKVSVAFYDKQGVPRTQSTLDSYGHTVGEFEKGSNAVHYHYMLCLFVGDTIHKHYFKILLMTFNEW